MSKIQPSLQRTAKTAEAANQELLLRGGGKIASDAFVQSVRSGSVTLQDLREAHSIWQSSLSQAMEMCPRGIQMGRPDMVSPSELQSWQQVANAENLARAVLITAAEHMQTQPHWDSMRSVIESTMPELEAMMSDQ